MQGFYANNQERVIRTKWHNSPGGKKGSESVKLGLKVGNSMANSQFHNTKIGITLLLTLEEMDRYLIRVIRSFQLLR